MRQEEGEFLAAEAAGDIGIAQTRDAGPHRLRDDAIAGRMAVDVVDAFEVVQVHRDQAERITMAQRQRHSPGALFLEGATRQRLRQRIGIGEQPVFQRVHGDAGEILQVRDVVGIEGARNIADRAERPDMVAIPGGKGNARIGAHVRRARYRGVVQEARIEERVGHDQRPSQRQRMLAKCLAPRNLGGAEPLAGLVPLAMAVDRRKRRHRHFQESAGQPGYAVENLLARRIQEIVALDGGKPFDLALL